MENSAFLSVSRHVKNQFPHPALGTSLESASDAFPSTAPLPGLILSRNVCTTGRAQIEISLLFAATSKETCER